MHCHFPLNVKIKLEDNFPLICTFLNYDDSEGWSSLLTLFTTSRNYFNTAYLFLRISEAYPNTSENYFDILTLSINPWNLISLNFWNSLLYKFLKLNLYKLLKLIFNTSQFLNFNRTWERPAYLKDPEYLTTKPLLRICLTVVVLLYGELDYLVS